MTEHMATPLQSIRSRFDEIEATKSQIREVDAKLAHNDEELLKAIGYKQEMRRSYNTLQTFGIAFSIMGLLPSIGTALSTGLELGSPGVVWGWFVAPFFIMCVGFTAAETASSIPTSGGLYFWTNYFCGDDRPRLRVPLGYFVGFANTMGLCIGLSSITWGFAGELLSAVYLNSQGSFEVTEAKKFGVFVAAIIAEIAFVLVSKGKTAMVQSFSIFSNLALIAFFFIAVPIGKKINHGGFNDAKFIFGDIENYGEYPVGWQFCMGMMVAIWTIGGFDSVIHMSEEAKSSLNFDPSRRESFGRMFMNSPLAIGIVGSIVACWIIGFFICIVLGACMDSDPLVTINTASGMPIAQIVNDSLGNNWTIAFMVFMCFCQYLMACSALVSSSRQMWAFARDNGLPFSRYLKRVNKKHRQPFNALFFAGSVSLIVTLIALAGSVAANALFSLSSALGTLAWLIPFLTRLTIGRKKFKPGQFYLGPVLGPIINWTSVAWLCFVLVLCFFPETTEITASTMNYTVALVPAFCIFVLLYYFLWKYKDFHGPRSNLNDDDAEDISEWEKAAQNGQVTTIDEALASTTSSDVDEKKGNVKVNIAQVA